MTKPINPFPPRLSPDAKSYLCDQCGREWLPGESSGCRPCTDAALVDVHNAKTESYLRDELDASRADFLRTRPKGWDGWREKVTITRVEYGPRPQDTKVILSDGRELDGMQNLRPHGIDPDGMCRVTLTAILKETKDA